MHLNLDRGPQNMHLCFLVHAGLLQYLVVAYSANVSEHSEVTLSITVSGRDLGC